MKTTNISRAKKRSQKSLGRKVKSEKRYGGNKKGKSGEITAGTMRARFFGGHGSGDISIPNKTDKTVTANKTNRNRFRVKAKHKARLKAKL